MKYNFQMNMALGHAVHSICHSFRSDYNGLIKWEMGSGESYTTYSTMYTTL